MTPVKKGEELAELAAESAALAAENAGLKARLAVLETKTAAPKEATRTAPKAIDEGTRVTSYLAPATAFVKPSEAELRRLFDITLAKFQTLTPTFESFCAAFKALSYMGRGDEPDRKRYPFHWREHAEILQRSYRRTVAPAPLRPAALRTAPQTWHGRRFPCFSSMRIE